MLRHVLSLASWLERGHRFDGSLKLLQLKFCLHCGNSRGKSHPVSLEQVTQGTASIPVLLLLSKAADVCHPLSSPQFSQGCRVQLLLGLPQEKNESGMEAGEVQSWMLSRAFSPDLIPQRGKADEGFLCLEFFCLQAFSSCLLRVKAPQTRRAGFSN